MNKSKEEIVEEIIKKIENGTTYGISPMMKASLRLNLPPFLTTHSQNREAVYKEIFAWLLGENGDFPDLSQKPHYSFRTELRKRLSALTPHNQELEANK